MSAASPAFRSVAESLGIGALGGGAFALLHLPAPWLAGSLIAGLVAVSSGFAVDVPGWLRTLAFILLGLQTGTSVSWDTLERAARWPLSIALLGVTVILVTGASFRFYRNGRGWDRSTALFASLPGALSLVLALADEAKADMRRVTISQGLRLVFLIVALPALISYGAPSQAGAPAPPSTMADVFTLLLLGGAAALLLERLKLPAGLILGAMFVSAALRLSGAVGGGAPAVVLIPANIILGVMIAGRFRGFSIVELKAAFAEALGGFLIALAIAASGAGLASLALGLPLALTLLAFSPGGLDAMTIMSFALGLDPAYVAAHQVARYLGLSLVLPPLMTWLMRRRSE